MAPGFDATTLRPAFRLPAAADRRPSAGMDTRVDNVTAKSAAAVATNLNVLDDPAQGTVTPQSSNQVIDEQLTAAQYYEKLFAKSAGSSSTPTAITAGERSTPTASPQQSSGTHVVETVGGTVLKETGKFLALSDLAEGDIHGAITRSWIAPTATYAAGKYLPKLLTSRLGASKASLIGFGAAAAISLYQGYSTLKDGESLANALASGNTNDIKDRASKFARSSAASGLTFLAMRSNWKGHSNLVKDVKAQAGFSADKVRYNNIKTQLAAKKYVAPQELEWYTARRAEQMHAQNIDNVIQQGQNLQQAVLDKAQAEVLLLQKKASLLTSPLPAGTQLKLNLGSP